MSIFIDGGTTLVIQAGPRTARIPVIVTDCDKPQPITFDAAAATHLGADPQARRVDRREHDQRVRATPAD